MTTVWALARLFLHLILKCTEALCHCEIDSFFLTGQWVCVGSMNFDIYPHLHLEVVHCCCDTLTNVWEIFLMTCRLVGGDVMEWRSLWEEWWLHRSMRWCVSTWWCVHVWSFCTFMVSWWGIIYFSAQPISEGFGWSILLCLMCV